MNPLFNLLLSAVLPQTSTPSPASGSGAFEDVLQDESPNRDLGDAQELISLYPDADLQPANRPPVDLAAQMELNPVQQNATQIEPPEEGGAAMLRPDPVPARPALAEWPSAEMGTPLDGQGLDQILEGQTIDSEVAAAANRRAQGSAGEAPRGQVIPLPKENQQPVPLSADNRQMVIETDNVASAADEALDATTLSQVESTVLRDPHRPSQARRGPAPVGLGSQALTMAQPQGSDAMVTDAQSAATLEAPAEPKAQPALQMQTTEPVIYLDELEGIRVHVDDDLSVEVAMGADGIEVVLDGTEEALEPLRKVAAELRMELEAEGEELARFSHRQRREDRPRPQGSQPLAWGLSGAPENEEEQTGPSRLGQIVNAVA